MRTTKSILKCGIVHKMFLDSIYRQWADSIPIPYEINNKLLEHFSIVCVCKLIATF